jgi:hypothetical protein
MRQPSITLRYPNVTDEQIAAAARATGESKYKTACRALALGASLMAGTNSDLNNDTQKSRDASRAEFDHQIHQLHRLADRVLYVACAAYVYSQRATMRSEPHSTKLQQELTDAVMAAYRRQLWLAEGERS